MTGLRPSILLVGPLLDPTFSHTIVALQRNDVPFDLLDVDEFWLSGSVEGRLDEPGEVVVSVGSARYRLGDYRSCYARLVDLRRAPDNAPPQVEWGRFRALTLALSAFEGLIVNRPGSGDSNASKPFQTSLIQRVGLRVPRSCSTNDPAAAARFIGSCERGAIYKSNSGIRSIVQEVAHADLDRLDSIRSCPVFFQERIHGADVRVHVVGDSCHAVRISETSTVDYRYDTSGTAVAQAVGLDPATAAGCVAATRAAGLVFSGIDFVEDEETGDLYCLEVNPMPGYSGYDHTLGNVISDSLVELLAAPVGHRAAEMRKPRVVRGFQ